MDLTLVFDRGNNVFTFLVLTPAEMRRLCDHRRTVADWMFLYDREVVRGLLGPAAAMWSPEGFTAYEEGLEMAVAVDGNRQRVALPQVRVEFESEPPEEPDDTGMVTVVLGWQGRGLIEYAWSGLEGPFDPARLTLRVRTHEHRGEMLLCIDRVSYAGTPAERRPAPGSVPEWLWTPSFFPESAGACRD